MFEHNCPLAGHLFQVIHRGVATIFPEVRTIFQISLPPPPPPPIPHSKFDRQKHLHRGNHALLCLLRSQALGENNVFTFYTIPLVCEQALWGTLTAGRLTIPPSICAHL